MTAIEQIVNQLEQMPEQAHIEALHFIQFLAQQGNLQQTINTKKVACQAATQRILEIAQQSNSVSEENRWTRNELYER